MPATQPSSKQTDSSTGERIVYGCFLLLGLGTLLPWNFFITAETYWQYKLRNVTSVPDYGNSTSDGTVGKTQLQAIYTPMQVCLSQFPNFVFLFISALFGHRVPIKLRLAGTLVVMMVLFTITAALAKINTDSWQVGFFVFTMIIIVLLNSAGAVFQAGLFGLAGTFPERYTTGAISGQALGGVFASTARIVSIGLGADDVNSAFIYFMIAVVVMLLTMLSLLYTLKSKVYAEFSLKAKIAIAQQEQEQEPLRGKTSYVVDTKRIMKQMWPLALSVCLVFWVTLAVFPAVCVKIVSSNETNYTWINYYFQPTMTFLLFNIGDYIGRQTAGTLRKPDQTSHSIYYMVGLRLVFIPLLLLCNHTGSTSSVPSVFMSDWMYGIIMLCFSLSNGYLGSLCMMYGPRLVDPGDAEKAGSLMAAMLGLGLLLGAMSSFAFGLIL